MTFEEFTVAAAHALTCLEGGSNANPIVWVHPLWLAYATDVGWEVGQPMTIWGVPVKFSRRVPPGEVRVVRDALTAGAA